MCNFFETRYVFRVSSCPFALILRLFFMIKHTFPWCLMYFNCQYSYLEDFKCSSRSTLRCFAGRMWPAGWTLPWPGLKGLFLGAEEVINILLISLDLYHRIRRLGLFYIAPQPWAVGVVHILRIGYAGVAAGHNVHTELLHPEVTLVSFHWKIKREKNSCVR